jgi:DNA polymerase-3 subunit beta
MQFSIEHDALLPILKRLSSVVPSKAMIPAHSSIKVVSSEPGTVKLYTYSPAIVTEGTIGGVSVTGPFEFGTDEGALLNVISSLPKGSKVDFSVGESYVNVKAGCSDFRLNIFREDMFLPPRNYPGLPFIEINMKAFVDSLRKVSFCSESRHERVERAAVCINSEHFVATDGHRMSLCPNKMFKTPHNILVSSDVVDRVQKLFDKPTGPGVFSGSESEIHLGYQGIYASVRLLTGSYPNYQSVIPQGPHTRCLVDRAKLLEATNRVLVLCGEASQVVRMAFQENRIDLFSSDPTYGEASESLPCECPGFAEPVWLTGNFVTEALKNYDTDQVVIELRTSVSPLTITDGEHINVLMPRRPGSGQV